jgi:small-conductance mechanosensitive channel
MKILFYSLSLLSVSSALYAKNLQPYDAEYLSQFQEEEKAMVLSQEMKVAYLTKILAQREKSYEEKISFLEGELRKTKDRLIEKSLNQEKIEDSIKETYKAEINSLKKELAYKTKTMFEYQRQIEKLNPSEEIKNLIKVNTNLAAELRKSEDQIAIIQLKQIESMPGIQKSNRMPASVKEK